MQNAHQGHAVIVLIGMTGQQIINLAPSIIAEYVEVGYISNRLNNKYNVVCMFFI